MASLVGFVAFPQPTIARESTEGKPEPIVKRLSGEELPPGFSLATSVVHMVKRAKSDPQMAKIYFEGRGLEVSDADLDYLVELYGEFDQVQAERHERVLREHSDEPEAIEASTHRYVMERATFTGGVLGAWLDRLRARGSDTDHFVAEVVRRDGVSAFWSGRPPTMERLDLRASAFEESFRREYGVALPALLDRATKGGGR